MNRWLVIAFVIFAPSVVLGAAADTTENNPTFYERESGDIVRFFYNDHYYLVDRDCEFKSIERVGPYDFQRQVFTGAFSDFDNQGRLILEGSYVDGRKQGDFKAYHPNGQLKWQVSYIHGVPLGALNFYYPDGKPLLEVTYTSEGIRILNFWDRRGEQRVIDGNGRYEFSVAADGYNEFGYIRYARKGKVINGTPHGNWTIKYIFADGKERSAGYEYYNKGRFLSGYESYTDVEFFDTPRYGLLPADFSIRADSMIAKTCTIDDHTGFTGFLAEYLSDWFKGEVIDRVVPRLAGPIKIEFTVTVKSTGEPRGIKMKSSFDTKSYADLLREALDGVSYWLPSYAAGQYIEDKLTVTMEAFPDVYGREMKFYEVSIKREKGR
ncbi:toxin-antitoxin system YwqK family antitoxin [Parapedobacter sp. 10938]|uniref:toxin-antitoxin system YwqK family antitoxin n=1 Tax=Parapedobacter flavus TaxID=3110225 RepID=UPI002DB65473|nr:hypothetical protein [Parapedobacter sp. 10938]MEC3881574.1 hypothetical protein [Parapedobacter sp. 10938]